MVEQDIVLIIRVQVLSWGWVEIRASLLAAWRDCA